MTRLESFLDRRREMLGQSAADVNGIAGIEVDVADPTLLRVRFVHPHPGETGGRPAGGALLDPSQIRISGGDRLPSLRVLSVAQNGPHVLEVRVEAVGDLSSYLFEIEDDVAGYDPMLRRIPFRFRAHCDTDLDCETRDHAPDPVMPEPRLDYLARDYESYRRMMLDRMAVTVPDWTSRNPADPGVTMVEWLAFLGDKLSYKLDHVGTEYSLGTSRLRVSAARHARLTGYRMHNGVSARVFVQVRLQPGVGAFTLPSEGTVFLTRARNLSDARISPDVAAREVQRGSLAFEPVPPMAWDTETGLLAEQPIQLFEANHDIGLHHWNDPDAFLPRGVTSAWLRNPDGDVTLRAGDVIVLMQTRDPSTGRVADVDPILRQAVRLIADPEPLNDPLEGNLPLLRVRWAPEDALRFDLHLGHAPGELPMAMALGNIVLADHGLTLPDEEPLGTAMGLDDPEDVAPGSDPLPLAALDRPRPFRPRLSRRDLTFAARPFVPEPGQSAAAFLSPDPTQAVAGITLMSDKETDPWTPRADLLGTPQDALAFVPEVENDGTTRLRFWHAPGGSEGLHGKTPQKDETFTARYRVGTGRVGNIGASAIAHVSGSGIVLPNIAAVTNPLPAQGGQDRETTAELRQRAPVAFNTQKRAVTLADYEALLTARDDIQRAQARKRALGGWSAIFLTVDRIGGGPVDDAFRQMLLDYLEPYRMMGHDLTIDAPIYVPLAITLSTCAAPDAFADSVRLALEDRFSTGLRRDGQRGFFHPDNITFSSDIYLSRIYEAALSVDGVADVRISEFRRAGASGNAALDAGVLRFGPREIPILSADPNRPSEGSLTILTEGGR